MTGKIKSNSSKCLVEHFQTGRLKNANYNVKIIQKWKGNGRSGHGVIDLTTLSTALLLPSTVSARY